MAELTVHSNTYKAGLMPNLKDYKDFYQTFTWEKERLVPGKDAGFNIAYFAVDRHAASSLSSHVALRFIKRNRETKDILYNDLKNLTDRFANVLQKLGINKNEVVFTLLGRVPELYVTSLGTFKSNCVFCPLFSAFGPEPVYQRLSRGKASILITSLTLYEKKVKPVLDRLPFLKYILLTDVSENIDKQILSYHALMREAPESFTMSFTEGEDPALLHFTSGTTGMPKGALHVHKAGLMHYITGKYVLDFHPQDVFWCTADPGWVTGTSYGIIAPLINGITNIIDEEEFDADRWYSILQDQKVSLWYTAPTAIRRLMRIDPSLMEKYKFKNLRQIYSVGEPLHADAVIWGEKTFGMPILDNWWQTETGGIMIANFPSLKVKPGSMGKPLPGIEVGIADLTEDAFNIITEPGKQGHLVLRKGWPSMFRAYINEVERYRKCFRGEWYLTGDLAKKDEDGYYWFVGRADDIIKTSGHMVGPFEVESALMQHQSIAEAAVIGKPEPTIGELVKAFIILKPNQKESEELRSDIIAFARKKLGTAVAPKEISFVTELPKTKSGKVLRRLLKARELGLPEGDTSTLEKE